MLNIPSHYKQTHITWQKKIQSALNMSINTKTRIVCWENDAKMSFTHKQLQNQSPAQSNRCFRTKKTSVKALPLPRTVTRTHIHRRGWNKNNIIHCTDAHPRFSTSTASVISKHHQTIQKHNNSPFIADNTHFDLKPVLYMPPCNRFHWVILK